jgi:hypothetical protein
MLPDTQPAAASLFAPKLVGGGDDKPKSWSPEVTTAKGSSVATFAATRLRAPRLAAGDKLSGVLGHGVAAGRGSGTFLEGDRRDAN